MGGHGGLNILPQKRWNIYNYENREKVRRDEEQAARDEQIKCDEVRKGGAELRLERLHTARGLDPLIKAKAEEEKGKEEEEQPELKNSGDNRHINLFKGIKIFDPIRETEKRKELLGEREGWKKEKRMKKEEGKSSGVVVGPEDEKYRLGYGVAGKGVKMPWHLEIRNGTDEKGGGDDSDGEVKNENKKKNGRKTLKELREERLKREKHEKEREKNDCQYDDVSHPPAWQSFATSLLPASNMNEKFERDHIDAFFTIWRM
ncbi:hypothetical protein HN51_070425 [Arachis hypogaea]|uniref:CBF1-interacting co-repressor CIR N-terminal domain-containing protein n=1 Tax=Arachis hypogaea TaxID=3818 RepID=A0A444Z244_ARAHY|nr:leukocyte receptor cluster member 1 homolog [Arachis ipaensis]XP_025650948.1 leukocyte receptor cluster member 1 homolog [Arachis hypogaea]QHO12823.1 uncharacterized protein DS421_15g510210 [Arachis hypogaea]RYR08235.1 hypothetical protein Ahy_B05g075807 [Arachis hypogaea]